MTPFTIIPAKPAQAAEGHSSPARPAPPAGPVLGSASFLAEDPSLQLEFDGYDIDVSAFDPSSITVNDPASGSLYQAASAVVLGGIIVQVTMTPPARRAARGRC